jgi:hypothetical protein
MLNLTDSQLAGLASFCKNYKTPRKACGADTVISVPFLLAQGLIKKSGPATPVQRYLLTAKGVKEARAQGLTVS